ncbi:MAG: alkaline phosphatase family protein [Dehalococcoidia bacterium]
MILIAVFDGLRPDYVSPDLTPVLWRLRQNGVWFSESHCVFPSVTRVNSPALATGSFPGMHLIPGNTMYVRAVNAKALLHTGRHEDLRELQRAGRLLGVRTLADVLREHGRRTAIVGTGSSGCTYLLNPEASGGDLLYHSTFSQPVGLHQAVVESLGPSPLDDPSVAPDERTVRSVEYGARVLTDVLLPKGRPDAAYFWCTIPDGFQHRLGLGEPKSLAALRRADELFGELLARVAHEIGEEPDVIVTSDHGYASVGSHIDARAALEEARLVEQGWFVDTVLAADGSSGLVYLPGDDGSRRHAVASYLLAQPWTAAVFTRDAAVNGTLSLADANIQSQRSPDIVYALAWSRDANRFGAMGSSAGNGFVAVGAGDHGGISPYEMHNTLIASGPSFKSGWTSTAACAITDVAPTALTLLGLLVPPEWTGRVLHEALKRGTAAPETRQRRIHAEVVLPGGVQVQQELRLAQSAGVSYVCEANKWLT